LSTVAECCEKANGKQGLVGGLGKILRNVHISIG
jgi:hypothetical protein